MMYMYVSSVKYCGQTLRVARRLKLGGGFWIPDEDKFILMIHASYGSEGVADFDSL